MPKLTHPRRERHGILPLRGSHHVFHTFIDIVYKVLVFLNWKKTLCRREDVCVPLPTAKGCCLRTKPVETAHFHSSAILAV